MNPKNNSKERACLALGASLALFLVVLVVPAHASEDSMTSLYCVSEAQWDALWEDRNAATKPIRELYAKQGLTVPTFTEPPYNPAKKCITVEMKSHAAGYSGYESVDDIYVRFDETCRFDTMDGSTRTILEGTKYSLDGAEAVQQLTRSWTIPANCDIRVHSFSGEGPEMTVDLDSSETGSDVCVQRPDGSRCHG